MKGSAPTCVPDCSGKECGDDGCDGTCGDGCASNQLCTETGTCRDPIVIDAMAQIPKGTYLMGSENGYSTELPVHSVTVEGFEMDVTEVTTAAYEDCVDAGECTAADSYDGCNTGIPARVNHPINCVDWNLAKAYCAWVGKRLPTEKEWEYAARGTDGREYPWGSEEPEAQLCWRGGGTGRDSTCEVGTFPGGDSPFGLHDMCGNVWEWTASAWSDDYNSEPRTDFRVFRGGSWFNDDPVGVRSSLRYRNDPSIHFSNLGFRCGR